MVTQIYGIPSEVWRPKKNMKFRCDFGQLKHEISVWFRTTLWVDCEYLQNARTHHQSENMLQTTDTLNLVYIRPQMAKNRTGVLTHPPAIVQRTGVNNSVAVTRGQQRAAIKLGIATHSSISLCCFKNGMFGFVKCRLPVCICCVCNCRGKEFNYKCLFFKLHGSWSFDFTKHDRL